MNNQQIEQPKQANYIFPNIMAKMMAATSPKVQYESSMMGTFLLLISVTLTLVFYVGFTANSWLNKGFIIFNAIAGYILLSSMLITTYQQYNQYMQAVQLMKLTTGEDLTIAPMNPSKIKRIRYISAGIESLIIVGAAWLFGFWYICIALLHPIYLIIGTNKFIEKAKLKEMAKDV